MLVVTLIHLWSSLHCLQSPFISIIFLDPPNDPTTQILRAYYFHLIEEKTKAQRAYVAYLGSDSEKSHTGSLSSPRSGPFLPACCHAVQCCSGGDSGNSGNHHAFTADSAPDTWTLISHAFACLVRTATPGVDTNITPLSRWRAWGWRRLSCHLPKVTQLVGSWIPASRAPLLLLPTLLQKKFKYRRESSLSSPWIRV